MKKKVHLKTVYVYCIGLLEQQYREKEQLRMMLIFPLIKKMAKTKSGQQTIRNIPADKLLLETDAPFTGMISSVNNLQNELESIIQDISLIRRENMMQQIKCNSENIFD